MSLFTSAFTVTETHALHPYPAVDYTDHWWNPHESGWGLSITQHASDRLFAVWFVDNQAAQPVWYTLQGSWGTFAQFTGPVYKTTGPYFGGPFDPNQVGVSQVGIGTLLFPDANSGQFSYTIEGVSGSKLITRLPF
jgi:lysyl endopeptidase